MKWFFRLIGPAWPPTGKLRIVAFFSYILCASLFTALNHRFVEPFLGDTADAALLGIASSLVGLSVSSWITSWMSRIPGIVLPRNARFLIMLFMANSTGDALLGDLEERFYRIANDPTQGPGRAQFWYWFQVVISLRPLAWAGLKRLTGLTALFEAIRKVIK